MRRVEGARAICPGGGAEPRLVVGPALFRAKRGLASRWASVGMSSSSGMKPDSFTWTGPCRAIWPPGKEPRASPPGMMRRCFPRFVICLRAEAERALRVFGAERTSVESLVELWAALKTYGALGWHRWAALQVFSRSCGGLSLSMVILVLHLLLMSAVTYPWKGTCVVEPCCNGWLSPMLSL
jgi:hypothetical protein